MTDVKNRTGSTQTWAGIPIGAGATLTIQEVERLRFASDPDFIAALYSLSQDASVIELGVEYFGDQGKAVLLRNNAFGVVFQSPPERANSFVAKNVQEAIEEIDTGGFATWERIPPNVTIFVKTNRQLIVADELIIEGDLIVEGSFAVV